MWKYQHVAEILHVYRAAFAAVRSGKKLEMSWSARPIELAGFREEFINAMNKRINLKGDDAPRGRKHSYEYRVSCMRDQQRLADIHERIRVYQFETKECRTRFGHLLSDWRE